MPFLAAVLAFPARAHRDDYLNETFVFQTLEAREFEPEIWLDLDRPSGPDASGRAYAAAFEYGVTGRWMVDAFVGWVDPGSGPTRFQRLRAETRYRFGEEGDRPVDIAASFETELEREPEPDVGGTGEVEKTYVLTPRLVLSRDLREFNLTLNVDLGREIRIGRHDRWVPGYAVGARYPRAAFLRYGVEFRQDFGDERASTLLPQVWLAFREETTLKIGLGRAHDGSERRTFLRIVLEKEF